MGLVERIWYGDRLADRMARRALAPASWLYGGVTAFRNALYDRGLRPTIASAVPALSLGNLSVGGTGKTPVAAWAVAALRERGATPGLVLRGYGGTDETLVHLTLNPGLPLVADPDRVRAVVEVARQGADCVVLDDAFQHRRIARVADWVLVAAEQWRADAWPLPAGPLRERDDALARATLLVVTRKTASLAEAAGVAARLARWVPGERCAIMHIAPSRLVSLDDPYDAPAAEVATRQFVAVAGIGAPDAFFGQLRALGASLDEVRFRDHHRYTLDDVRDLDRRAAGTDGVLCTLKDMVKLRLLWRGAKARLWYVSQAAAVDRGAPQLAASLESVLAARVSTLQNAGLAGPGVSANGL